MNRQDGNALLVTVMLLVLLGVMGIAALDMAMRDQQVAGFQNRSRLAFYAAEAGLAQGRDLLLGVASSDDTPPLPATSLGDTTIYPYGQPSFRGDPAFADPIRSIGTSLYTEGVNLRGGRPLLLQTFWQINAMGQTPGGATSRVEAVISTIGSDSAGYGG
jgi:PilX N-terminal